MHTSRLQFRNDLTKRMRRMAGTRRVVAWLRMVKRGSGSALAGRVRCRTTLRSVPSWGISFLLHALLLLILAFIIRFAAAGAARSDRSRARSSIPSSATSRRSLRPSDRVIRSPLEQNLNPPSIGLEPEHSGMQMTGQPHLASLTAVRADPGRPVAARRHAEARASRRPAASRGCPTWRPPSWHRFRADRV